MVECTALEMRHTRKRIGGSNPSSPPNYRSRLFANVRSSAENKSLYKSLVDAQGYARSLDFARNHSPNVGENVDQMGGLMARPIHRLSARAVASAKERGLYADGGGLFLQVARSGSRSWLFRFTLRGKTRHMGLGPTVREPGGSASRCF